MLKWLCHNFIIFMTLVFCSCQMPGKNTQLKDGYEILYETRDFKYQTPELDKLKIVIEKDLLPLVTENENKDLNNFLSTIQKASDQKEAFFDNAPEFAKLVKGNANTILILYNYLPADDLQAQLKIPSSLLMAGDTLKLLENLDSQESKHQDFSEDIALLKKKSLELSEKTLSRFPNEGRAYGQVGFVLARIGGDKHKALQMYKRCMDLDKDASFCKEGYHTLQQSINN